MVSCLKCNLTANRNGSLCRWINDYVMGSLTWWFFLQFFEAHLSVLLLAVWRTVHSLNIYRIFNIMLCKDTFWSKKWFFLHIFDSCLSQHSIKKCRIYKVLGLFMPKRFYIRRNVLNDGKIFSCLTGHFKFSSNNIYELFHKMYLKLKIL